MEHHAFTCANHVVENGFGEISAGHFGMAKSNFDHATASLSFRLDPGLIAAKSDQRTALRSRMFDRDPHQGLDELVEDDLARHGLRGLDYCPDVEVRDRRADRSGRRGRSSVIVERRVKLVNLSHLTMSTPTEIAVAGVSQIGVGDRLEAARGVEPRSSFMRDGFILDEAVFPR